MFVCLTVSESFYGYCQPSFELAPKSYHGDVFKDNACRKMHKNPDVINDPDVLGDVSPLAVQPIIMAFKDINKVVDDCFFTGKDSKSLCDDVIELNRLYKGTELNKTLKIYVLIKTFVK